MKVKDFNGDLLKVKIKLSKELTEKYADYCSKGESEIYLVGSVMGDTFRKMYAGNDNSEQSKWVREHAASTYMLNRINDYILGEYEEVRTQNGEMLTITSERNPETAHGKFLYELPFGGLVYSVNGMSVVVDNDCMSKDSNKALKYVILRENGKLYSQWDDKGSLIF